MTFTIQQPVFLHEKGKRGNNEDSIYPFEGAATTEDRLFIVCDGVGGANKGEIASRMVCELFHAYFTEHPSDTYDQSFFDNALIFVEQKLSEHIAAHQECAGMATTLTLLYFDETNNRVTIAWSGDSRVHHVREGKILFETEDHSLVNELMKRGELTPEEAKVHPQRNVILRAISGSETPTQLDVHHISDVQPGDFFMLSTDGILESIDDRILVTLLTEPNISLENVKDNIKELCDQYSHDNFSMYLVQVEDVEEDALPLTTDDGAAVVGEIDDSPDSSLDKNNKKLLYLLSIAALSILVVIGVFKLFEIRQEQKVRKIITKGDQLVDSDSLKAAKTLYEQALEDYPDKEKLQDKLDKVNNELAFRKQAAFQDSVRNELSYLLLGTDDSIKAMIDTVILEKIKSEYDTAALRILIYQLDTLLNPQSEVDTSEIDNSDNGKKSDSE